MNQTHLFSEKPEPNFLSEFMASFPQERAGLRYYQDQAVAEVKVAFDSHRCVLIVMATGTGKTQVFSQLAFEWDKGDVLILAHRDELVDQARARYEQMFGGFVDVEKADFRASPRSHIVVGSVPSFHKKRREKMSRCRYGLIIVDEGHHALAKSYRDLFEYFAEAKILLVTATPDRGDGKAMGKLATAVPYRFDIQDGIEQGYLVPVIGERIALSEIKLDSVGVSKGEFVIEELDQAMVEAVDPIVAHFLEFSKKEQGILFFPGLRSATYAQSKMNLLRPGCCAYIDGDTEFYLRKQIVKEFRDGRYQFLSNCQIAIEGFDAPNVSIIGQAAPTLSRMRYAQKIGRGTRVLPGLVDHLHGPHLAEARRELIAKSAKPHCTIIDYVGNSSKFTLQTPENALGGNFSDEEVELAKKERKEGAQVLQALRDARAKLIALAQAAKVRAKVEATRFDPFRVLGVTMPGEERYAKFGLEPATDKQLSFFREKGVDDKDLAGLSYHAAEKLQKRFTHRRLANLATYRQMKVLGKFGIFDSTITFARARAALDYISSKGWGRDGVNPKLLADICGHRREPGEEAE